MYKNKRVLALILARGGSKGLIKKNIRKMFNKPLIEWSIEHGLKSKYIDDVVVSTDDAEIAEVAEKCGANVPFLRPEELAKDSSPSIDSIIHAVEWFENKEIKYDCLVLLEPTSPLRDENDIDGAIEMLFSHGTAESIVGVCKAEAIHPSFLCRIEKGFLVPYQKTEFEIKQRQEIEPLFFFEGSLYIAFIESLKKRKRFYHEKTLGFAVPKWKSYEVDELSDFILIEALLKAKLEGVLK